MMLFVTALLLIWVTFFGPRINDGSRWINLLGLSFQPSEIAKGTLVLTTAQILSAMQLNDGSGADKKAMKWILRITLPFIFCIGIENLSTACLLFMVIFLMMFIGRVPLIQMGKLMAAGVALVAVFLTMVLTLGSIEGSDEAQSQTAVVTEGQAVDQQKSKGPGIFHRFATWRNRILNHSGSGDVSPEEYDMRKNYQVAHANIAIASSGIIGKGPGNSTERDYLPQAFSDFIFAIIIEEMGILGALAVVFLYVILLFRCARIATRCANNFPAFLVLGLAMLLTIQATINMLVAVGLFPVTGQPLPLISRGGTSTVINCAYIGAILSVSRTAQKVEPRLAN
jgi:cell division protein FtsW